LQIKTEALSYIVLVLVVSLFQGCSGHTLQDWIDGDTTDPSAKNSEQKSKTVPPSQNKALNSISPSSTASDDHEEYRYMQKNTNAWIKEDWEPLTESNATEKVDVESDKAIINSDENTSVSQEDNSSSGLQYYVDKADVYFENKKKRDANKTKVPSHTEKINAMPGIGKPTGRR